MTTQLLFSDLMAAAVVASSTTTTSSVPNTTTSNVDVSQSATYYSSGPGSSLTTGQVNSGNTKGIYLEDQRALQLAFELSMLNNNNNGTTDANTNNGGSHASSMSSSSSLGHSQQGAGAGVDQLNPTYFHGHHQQQRHQSNTGGNNEYENVLQHFLGSSGNHEPALNNLGSQFHHQHQQQQHQYDEMVLEKFLLNQNNMSNGDGNVCGDYYNQPPQQQQQQRNNGQHQLNHHSASTLNNLITGISSMNMNSLTNSAHGYSNGGGHGQGGNGGGSGHGGLLNETERFKKSQNMTECVPVPSSEHVAEIVGRQGCKIKALRAKTNTYIKTPVRGEEPVFVVTGRKEDVGKAKKEILSAAEHFSLIRASRKPSLTNGGSGGGGSNSIGGMNSMAGSPLLSASGPNNGLGDIFSSSSSGDDSPSILTKNPIGLTSAAAAAAAAGHNQITVQVRVPYRVVGLVVGPKGATIKNIQQQTHTYIVTPSRDKEPIFEVTGAVENVEIARQQIEAHIAMRTGGNSEGSDNLSNYFNSINNRTGKDLQDELQLLNENFGQSTNFLRKYLNGQNEDQAQDNFGNYHAGEQKTPQHSASLAAMELLVSQLAASGGQNDGDLSSSVDLFGNRMRIEELLQTMQKQTNGNGNPLQNKRDSDNIFMGRNLFAQDYNASSNNGGPGDGAGYKGHGCGNSQSLKSLPMANEYYSSFSGDATGKNGQNCGGSSSGDEQAMLRRQLLSNNSEDDEGVGLDLQEASPPNTSTNIMKMFMDEAEENKKYLWSTLSGAVANAAVVNNGGSELVNVNHSSDSSCLSSASPSPTLSKFFTFQNGASHNGNGGTGNQERTSQDVELAAQMM